MDSLTCPLFSCQLSHSSISSVAGLSRGVVFASSSGRRKISPKKVRPPKNNLRSRRRTELPPDFQPVLRRVQGTNPYEVPAPDFDFDSDSDSSVGQGDNDGNIEWEADEIEAISSLFQGRVPQKPGKLGRERPLPLPLPHKIRPLGLPTSKKLVRTHLSCSARQPKSNQIYKNPTFLISLARDIRNLHPEENVSTVLDQWARFLRKGSMSLTIRELGHMDLPNRALHVYCWAQGQPHLFPDDRILASTVEVLAAAHELKLPFDLEKLISLASQSVYEAMIKGSIKGGNVGFAWRLLSAAIKNKRVLDPGIYAKVILELGKNPDKRALVTHLLEELAKRDDLKLAQQDCTAIMKVCISMGKFDIVEALYDWYKRSGTAPSVVMYTTLIHSRYTEHKHREAMAIVWEMEASDCLLDLPAYRVLLKLFIALDDLPRASRYFSKLKESGFSPTGDVYRGIIGMYKASGRLAKCKQILREAEMAGYKLDEQMSDVLM